MNKFTNFTDQSTYIKMIAIQLKMIIVIKQVVNT